MEKPQDKPTADPAADPYQSEFDRLREAAAPDPDAPAAPPASTIDIKTGEVLTQILTPVADIVCPAWKLQPAELQQLGDAYGALIDKYFPDGLTRWGAELNAALVTVMILGPRLKMARRADEKTGMAPGEKPAAAEPAADPGGQVGPPSKVPRSQYAGASDGD